jgi:ribonuclease VapC
MWRSAMMRSSASSGNASTSATARRSTAPAPMSRSNNVSALTAMIAGEPDDAELLARVEQSERRLTSPIAIWETAVAVAKIIGVPIAEAERATRTFLDAMQIEAVAIPADIDKLAIRAFDRFGKGRHPAKLNFGDCFAYACARHYAQPLLYKGSDFALTDITPA